MVTILISLSLYICVCVCVCSHQFPHVCFIWILIYFICMPQVLQGLDSASNCVDDMDEWLGIFNVKLRHMREDIESVYTFKICIDMEIILCNIEVVLQCSMS